MNISKPFHHGGTEAQSKSFKKAKTNKTPNKTKAPRVARLSNPSTESYEIKLRVSAPPR
jgi:hypothetical protein